MSKRIAIATIIGFSLFAGTAESARSQERAHQRFLDAVEDKQRYEADERAKDREAALEIERMRTNAGNEGRGARSILNASNPNYYQSYLILASGDPLAGTDAIAYRLGNGVIMRVSGVLWPGEEVSCIANCQ